MPENANAAAVDAAINTRQSVRAFLPTPVARDTVEMLLKLAARSASGSNIQPWRVRIIGGDVKERLEQAIFDAVERDGFEPYQREWNYYPVNWREPFHGRRRHWRSSSSGSPPRCMPEVRYTSRRGRSTRAVSR